MGILAHRSLLQQGVPYDIPDFHREEDRKKYENDTLLPIPRDNEAPNMPCCSHPDYLPDPQKFANYLEMVK